MRTFNVISYNFNTKKFEPYNVIPHLVNEYYKKDKKPETFEEFKKFVESEAHYQWWARCEYEIILCDWPTQEVEAKWDVYRQIMMNLDIITRLVIWSISEIDQGNYDN